MCSCISITRIHLEIIIRTDFKIGMFLSRSQIGWDSGFSSKIGRILTKSGWLDSLPTLPIGNPEYMYSVASISFHHVSG